MNEDIPDYFDTCTIIAEQILIPIGLVKKGRWRIWGQNLELPMDGKPFLIGRCVHASPYGFRMQPQTAEDDDCQKIHTNVQETLQFTFVGDYRAAEKFQHGFFAALNTDEADRCQEKFLFRLFQAPSSISMGRWEIGGAVLHRADVRVQTLRARTTVFHRQTVSAPKLGEIKFEA